MVATHKVALGVGTCWRETNKLPNECRQAKNQNGHKA